MTPRRKRPTVARRSPDKVLREATMNLRVLEGTLLDIREGLQSVRPSFITGPDLRRAIDELGYVSGELNCTWQEIGKARTEIRRRRAATRPKPN